AHRHGRAGVSGDGAGARQRHLPGHGRTAASDAVQEVWVYSLAPNRFMLTKHEAFGGWTMTETRAPTHAPHSLKFLRRPSGKVGVSFLIFAGFMVWNYVHRPAPNPIGGLGPEWECDPTSPARLCLKDVRIVRPDSIVDRPRGSRP